MCIYDYILKSRIPNLFISNYLQQKNYNINNFLFQMLLSNEENIKKVNEIVRNDRRFEHSCDW